MKSKSTFQIILIVVFIFFAVLGVLAFSGLIPTPSGNKAQQLSGEVTIWGSLPEREMKDFIGREFANDSGVTVHYVEKEESTFDRELVEALASNRGPDIIFLPENLILRHSDKVFVIPYDSLPERQFKDTFVQEGELYLMPEGSLAIPVTVDPLVMYWNRDLFASAGIVNPPKYWDEFFTIVDQLTFRSQGTGILRSGVALGEYSNVRNAKDILAAMIMQAGDTITATKPTDGSLEVVFGEPTSALGAIIPAESALRFYTEFANPGKVTYSWNRSLANSDDMFVSGDLAIYFGFASELKSIQKRNPHLNFDVAPLPQIRDQAVKSTLGHMEGLAILRDTQNFQVAFQVATRIAASDKLKELLPGLGLAPARRAFLTGENNNANAAVFYSSALISKAWLDPNPTQTEGIFKAMIEDVTSGRRKVSDSVAAARRSLDEVVKK